MFTIIEFKNDEYKGWKVKDVKHFSDGYTITLAKQDGDYSFRLIMFSNHIHSHHQNVKVIKDNKEIGTSFYIDEPSKLCNAIEWDCRNKNIVRMKKFLDEIIGQEETVKQKWVKFTDPNYEFKFNG